MIYFSKEASEKLDLLFYYPYTFGKHLDKANHDLQSIRISIQHLSAKKGAYTIILKGIGRFVCISDGRDIIIQHIDWSVLLTRFYYTKSNFITLNNKSNIPCGHPSQYKERHETYFKCDNGFKVISRNYGDKEVFNFKDLDGHIICDIDFTQVKPFSEYKDMTARGYVPNRRCYVIFENGYMEEVNEQKKFGIYNSIITDCINTSLKKYIREQIKI